MKVWLWEHDFRFWVITHDKPDVKGELVNLPVKLVHKYSRALDRFVKVRDEVADKLHIMGEEL